MSYISSSKIEVFPVAKHRIASEMRVFTEKNISNLSRQLLSENKDGYIISCDKKGNWMFDISFNLYGYYFNISDFDTEAIVGPSIYASIEIEDGEIKGQDTKLPDDSYVYQGLNITTNIPSIEEGQVIKYIKLFEYVNNTWECVSQNFGLISALVIGGIDGKHS